MSSLSCNGMCDDSAVVWVGYNKCCSARLGYMTLLLFCLCKPSVISACTLGCLTGVSAICADNGGMEVPRSGVGEEEKIFDLLVLVLQASV